MNTPSGLRPGSPGLQVAYRLLLLCQEQDMSLNELARQADVPLSTIKNILNGASRNPGIATIDKLCAGLGVSLGDFFTDPVFSDPGRSADKTEEMTK